MQRVHLYRSTVYYYPEGVGYYNNVTVQLQAKTSLVHTSNFAWLMTCKTFCNKVMSNPANLNLVALCFPTKVISI